MNSSTHSLSRRLSFESTTTSEFEVVSRERSASGSTVEDSYCQELSASSSPSPSASFRIPDLCIECHSSEQDSPPNEEPPSQPTEEPAPQPTEEPAPQPTAPTRDDTIRSFSNVASQVSGSDVSTMARESAGMLEQVFHELFTLKRRNSMLERMAQQSNEWRVATKQLEKEVKVLHKTMKAYKSREDKLQEEVNQLRQEKEELLAKEKPQEADSSQIQSTSWLRRIIVVGIIIAVIAAYMECYAQFLKEHRHSKDLQQQLSIMHELVDKLEVERAAEYQRQLEETSKRITDDMSADIARAQKERELEHERLIEAYREKMLLYDDLTTLRKEKSQKKKKFSSWYH
ncbi:hypothetical protein GCK32_001494 [Trichostrongylus colubriformis]|uniref:Uncharacterized protein n=1 Tax=Trichostrongylus colubriformis TaxID=6319 RepID=A0AAN8EWC0_TRICO